MIYNISLDSLPDKEGELPRKSEVALGRRVSQSELVALTSAKIERFLDDAWNATPAGGKRLTTQQATARVQAMKGQDNATAVYGVDSTVARRHCAAVCVRGESAVWLYIFFRQGEDDWYLFKYQLVIKPHRPTAQQRKRGAWRQDRQRPVWFRTGARR